MTDLIDTRQLYEPDLFSHRDLPDYHADEPALFREMAEGMKEVGGTFFRFTIVSDEYPQPPYPHGLYVEGWLVDPARMEVPGKQAAFNYPLVAA